MLAVLRIHLPDIRRDHEGDDDADDEADDSAKALARVLLHLLERLVGPVEEINPQRDDRDQDHEQDPAPLSKRPRVAVAHAYPFRLPSGPVLLLLMPALLVR